MSGFVGLNNVFFGNLTVKNNPDAPAKGQKLHFQSEKPIADTIAFGKKRLRNHAYTSDQNNLMSALKQIALKLGLPCFYTGERFNKPGMFELKLDYLPTIEHIIPFSEKKTARLKDVNSLKNLVLVGSEINGQRNKKSLKRFYRENPEFLENGRKALKQYQKINTPEGALFDGSPPIRGKKWVRGIKKVLNAELGYMAFTGNKVQTEDNISFAKNHRPKTKYIILSFDKLRQIALEMGLPCFYTGERFNPNHKATVEHLIPRSKKNKARKAGKLERINAPENIVPAGAQVNSTRSSIPLNIWYEQHPEYLEKSRAALAEYEKIQTPKFNGKRWAGGVKKLLNNELGYVAFTGNKEKQDESISFGIGKYTNQRMQALRTIAVKMSLPCIYTGKKFGKDLKPTIEHLLPKSAKTDATNYGLRHINVIGNWTLAESKINGARNSMPLSEWYEKHPECLEKSKEALAEYEKVDLPEVGVNGYEWVRRIKRTLNKQLGYLAFTANKNSNV